MQAVSARVRLLTSQVPASVPSLRYPSLHYPVLCGPPVLAFYFLCWWSCGDQREEQGRLPAPTLMGGGFPFQVSMRGVVRGRRASLGHNRYLVIVEAEQGQRHRDTVGGLWDGAYAGG